MTEPVLIARNIQKRFGAFKALDDVDFSLGQGEVRALLGVNGAGKSTFIKILSGHYTKDGGSLGIAGAEVTLGTPAAAQRAGIASVQQHPELVEDLTAYENIFLGNESTGLRYDRAALRDKAYKLVARYNLNIELEKPVAALSAVERELVAILRAVTASDIKILILDEPTSVLTEREKKPLFELIKRFRMEGVGVIYITHRLDEVFEIADSFTVFRGGKVICTRTTQAHSNTQDIAEMMLGTSLGEVYPAKNPAGKGQAILTLEDVSLAGAFENISLELRKGEIVGVFGLLGSGLDELSKAIFGALQATSGRIIHNGDTASYASPRDALKAGIFLVPGDRRSEGLTPSRDVEFNATLSNLSRVSLAGLLKFSSARRQTHDLASKVDLQPLDIGRKAEAFSGGNQQKIVIAKGLFAQAEVYIFMEPTVGVDIGARAKIYSLIRELSRDAAVLVMSSDADEVHGLSDDVVALFRGRVAASGSSAALSREALLIAGLAGKSVLADAGTMI